MAHSAQNGLHQFMLVFLTSVRRIETGRLKGLEPAWTFLGENYRKSYGVLKRVRFFIVRALARPKPGEPDQIHLSWNEDPSVSFTVTWHTPSRDASAAVNHRPREGGPWQTTVAETTRSPGLGYMNRCTIRGLSPASVYEYWVAGANAGPPESPFVTRTAPPNSPADYCFAFISDVGIIGRRDGLADGVEQIMRFIEQDDPLFILGGGDYAYAQRDFRYPNTAAAIDSWFVQMQRLFARYPFMAGLGNHETYHDETYADWGPRFALPEGPEGSRYYSFDIGDVHFTCLFIPGSRHCTNPSERQLSWLEADLAKARERGCRWLVVYQHDAVFAHGHTHPSRYDVQAKLGPIFEKFGVDLVFSGHDQNLERTYPLVGLPDNVHVANRDRHRYRAGEGVVYAKVSPSGKTAGPEFEQSPNAFAKKYFSEFRGSQPDFIAVRDDTAHHYALIEVSAERGLKVKIYQVPGGQFQRNLIDCFEIVQPESR